MSAFSNTNDLDPIKIWNGVVARAVEGAEATFALIGADGLRTDLEIAAAENVKRVVLGQPDSQSLYEISAFLELKTVWHPIGT